MFISSLKNVPVKKRLGDSHAKTNKRWSVYILRCADGSLYTGISNDVSTRLKKHNLGKGAAYTRSHRPVTLVWRESQTSESAARKREAQIKKLTKIKKEEMIEFGIRGQISN